MKQIIFFFLVVLVSAMVFVPMIVAAIWQDSGTEIILPKEQEQQEITSQFYIPVQVYRTNQQTIETYPLEEYVRGVVAAEMPIDFQIEALKAQAIAARTYIVKRILDKNLSDVPEGAMVTDSIQHQVFLSDEELRERWGIHYKENMAKLNQAIHETMGQVVTYQGKPIVAFYFSTSNGYTENAEDYWGKAVPYLKSVPSPWDLHSPKFEDTVTISMQNMLSALNVDAAVAASTGETWIKLLEKTPSNRVKKIKIGDKIFTGREIREKLKLPSTSFTWEIHQGAITFHTKGYGHGVGMSQYGADGMAKEGKTAEEIVQYYYQGVQITDIKQWVTKK